VELRGSFELALMNGVEAARVLRRAAGVDHHRALPPRPRQRHRPRPSIGIALDQGLRMLVGRPVRALPLGRDGEGAVLCIAAPEPASRNDAGAAGAVEDQPGRACRETAIVGRDRHLRSGAELDRADHSGDYSGAGGDGAFAQHFVERIPGNMKAGILRAGDAGRVGPPRHVALIRIEAGGLDALELSEEREELAGAGGKRFGK
jgi:hypothetical protein